MLLTETNFIHCLQHSYNLHHAWMLQQTVATHAWKLQQTVATHAWMLLQTVATHAWML